MCNRGGFLQGEENDVGYQMEHGEVIGVFSFTHWVHQISFVKDPILLLVGANELIKLSPIRLAF